MLFRKRTKATRVDSVDTLASPAASGRPVLVEFMQASCAPCKVMDGIVDEAAVTGTAPAITQRRRATGLIKKDALRKVLESNGAAPSQ